MLMDQVETLHVCGYWSEMKFYAVPSQPTSATLRSRSWDIDFDKFSGKAQVRRATLSWDSSYFWLRDS